MQNVVGYDDNDDNWKVVAVKNTLLFGISIIFAVRTGRTFIMRSLFFVITLFILNACYAKKNETVVYSLDLSPEETWYNDRYGDVFDCAFLCLFNNGMCTIELYSYLTDDQVYYSTLFIGGYRWKNRTLRIEDNVNNYKFDLKKRRGRLKVISGFPFMIDRIFWGITQINSKYGTEN